MKKIILIFSLLLSTILPAQTQLTLGRIDTIWSTGQVPKGLNNTNTWYSLFKPRATAHVSGYLDSADFQAFAGITNNGPLFFANAATTASLTATYSTNTLTATSNGRLANQDGISLTLNDSILVKNQPSQLQNGLYYVLDTGITATSPYVLVRCVSYDETAEVYPSQVNVLAGTVNGTKYFLQTTVDPVIGTNPIVFSSIATPVSTGNIYTSNGTLTGAAGSTRVIQLQNKNITFIGTGATFRVDQTNIQLNAGTGASSQIKLNTSKLGFYTTVPITKPAAVTTPQGLYTGLSNLGLIAPGTITSFSTNSITATSAMLAPTVTYSISTTDVVNTTCLNNALATIPSLFTDAGAYTYLTSTTDLFQVGSSTTLSASLGIKGQGATAGTYNRNSTNSSNTLLERLTDAGELILGGGTAAGLSGTPLNIITAGVRTFYGQSTSTTGNVEFVLENNRGSLASFGYLGYGGSAYAVTHFGITGADKTMLLASGANNLGILIGTENAATPIVFGTSNTERARITGTGELLIGATTDPTGLGFKQVIVHSGIRGTYQQMTTASNYLENFFENNRGSYASYGEDGYGGSTCVSTRFGLTIADVRFSTTGGASNLGYAIGTGVASPLYFGTNDIVRGTILSTGVWNIEKTFGIKAGTSTTYANAGGAIKDFYTDVNNGTTVETDLYTFTTTANTLAASGEKLLAEYTGTFNDLTATSQLQVYFGGTNIANTGALTVSAVGAWVVRVTIIRTNTTTARASVNVSTPGASTAVYASQTDLTGLDFTTTNIIKITGTAGGASGGSSDITAKMGTISWMPAAN